MPTPTASAAVALSLDFELQDFNLMPADPKLDEMLVFPTMGRNMHSPMRAQLLEDRRTFRESLSLINQARGQNLLTTCRWVMWTIEPLQQNIQVWIG